MNGENIKKKKKKVIDPDVTEDKESPEKKAQAEKKTKSEKEKDEEASDAVDLDDNNNGFGHPKYRLKW